MVSTPLQSRLRLKIASLRRWARRCSNSRGRVRQARTKVYLGLPNYTNNWKRQGFTEDDIADGGSDRLVDALVVWGDEATIAARVQEQRDAGADHVCIQVLTNDPPAFPAEQWRALAPALISKM
jgi:probable F420-dependent oxidoreductase